MTNTVKKLDETYAITFQDYLNTKKYKNSMRMINQLHTIPQIDSSNNKAILRSKKDDCLNLKGLSLASKINISSTKEVKIYIEGEPSDLYLPYDHAQSQMYHYLGRNLYLKCIGFSVSSSNIEEDYDNPGNYLVKVIMYF